MKKRLLKLLLCIAALFAFLYAATWLYYRQKGIPKQNSFPSIVSVKKSLRLQWVPVHWQKDEFSDRSAMYLPVYLDTISKPFWMQFDLGTSISDLYNISGNFPFLKQKEKLFSQETGVQNNPLNYCDFNLRLSDSLLYHAEHIPILAQLADTLSETGPVYNTKVGDLGYDLIKNRILIIDYKQSRIAITDSLAEGYAKNIKWFTDVLIDQMPMYLPILINGTRKYMQFDNGSSAFTIWTSVDQWNSWRDHKVKADTFTGYSWGVKEYYLRAMPSVSIHFLEKDIDNLPIWGVNKEATRKKSFFQSIKAFTDKHFGKVFTGCIGNEYFRDEVIIFDTQRNRLGIQQKKDE